MNEFASLKRVFVTLTNYLQLGKLVFATGRKKLVTMGKLFVTGEYEFAS